MTTENRQFPLLLRNDLDFGRPTAFALSVSVWSNITVTLYLGGYTKQDFWTQTLKTTGTATVPTLNTFTFQLSDIPIGLSIFNQSANLDRGRCYCRIDLTLNTDIITTLASGYVTDHSSVAWPYGTHEASFSGNGSIRGVSIADPAANTELTFTTPTGMLTKLKSFRAVLVTDANVANRSVGLSIDIGAGQVIMIPAPAVQVASTTRTYIFSEGVAFFEDTTKGVMVIPIPAHLVALSSASYDTIVTNRQVGDNWGAAQVGIEEWVYPNDL